MIYFGELVHCQVGCGGNNTISRRKMSRCHSDTKSHSDWAFTFTVSWTARIDTDTEDRGDRRLRLTVT